MGGRLERENRETSARIVACRYREVRTSARGARENAARAPAHLRHSSGNNSRRWERRDKKSRTRDRKRTAPRQLISHLRRPRLERTRGWLPHTPSSCSPDADVARASLHQRKHALWSLEYSTDAAKAAGNFFSIFPPSSLSNKELRIHCRRDRCFGSIPFFDRRFLLLAVTQLPPDNSSG